MKGSCQNSYQYNIQKKFDEYDLVRLTNNNIEEPENKKRKTLKVYNWLMFLNKLW